MSSFGPQKDQSTEKQLFLSIMRNKDTSAKKAAIAQLEPEQKRRFTVFYKSTMAKAEQAKKIRDDIEKLEAQRAEILHQNAQSLAKDLDSINTTGTETPARKTTRPAF